MRQNISFRWQVIAIGALVAGGLPHLPATAVEVTFAGSTNVFGGGEVELPISIDSEKASRGVWQWRLSANRRTLDAGESVLQVEAGQNERSLRVRVPEPKEGVVLEAELSVFVSQEDRPDLQQKVWIFSNDPFADRTEWLRDLNIALYDPEGQTADVFEKAGIPHRTCRTFTTVRELDNETLVVGEGVSLTRHRGLSELLLDRAAHGVNVICLAPLTGRFPLPAVEVGGQSSPEQMSFRSSGVLSELDKRFDVLQWANQPSVLARLQHRAIRSQVTLEVVSETDADDGAEVGQGWPWWEVVWNHNASDADLTTEPDAIPQKIHRKIHRKRSSLLVCGFGVIRHWEQSPTPRFALARLMERQSDRGQRLAE